MRKFFMLFALLAVVALGQTVKADICLSNDYNMCPNCETAGIAICETEFGYGSVQLEAWCQVDGSEPGGGVCIIACDCSNLPDIPPILIGG